MLVLVVGWFGCILILAAWQIVVLDISRILGQLIDFILIQVVSKVKPFFQTPAYAS